MKTLQTIFFALFITFTTVASAQTKSETFKVSGECGMCKKKIEGAAKQAGATYAEWNTDTKVMTVKYNSSSTNKAKIEQAIAGVGYDTQSFKATEDAYSKLHECCKYERNGTETAAAHSCCDDEKCTKTACMKDGKCTPDTACCKEAGCDKKDCCKKA
jgi:hypothetical protein